MEDVIGEKVLIPFVSNVIGKKLSLNKDDRAKGSLVDQIVSAASRAGEDLPDGWKPEAARQLAVGWSTAKPDSIPTDVLDRAESLFKAITERFDEGITA